VVASNFPRPAVLCHSPQARAQIKIGVFDAYSYLAQKRWISVFDA
jgi:hypothetical protein